MKQYYGANHILLHQALDSCLGEDRTRVPFDSLPHATYTCDLGPQTVEPMHRNVGDFPRGVCILTVSGDFNWNNGVEVLLLEPKLIVQLQPRYILIFSSTVTYGNLGFSDLKDQVRYTFTCHTASPLFEWASKNAP